MISEVACPYCKLQTNIPGGFDEIDVGRFTCELCRSEFLIIDNVPMTQEQYQSRAQ
jgi:transposase-like protein